MAKVAILVDALENKGGIERVVLLQAEMYGADIYTGKYSPETTFEEFSDFDIKVINNQNLPRRVWSLINRYKFGKLKLNYDLIIMHGGASLSAARRNKKSLWYCHSPTIWLYSTTKEDLAHINFFKRVLVRLAIPFLKMNDRKNVGFVSKIVTNSRNVAGRVRSIYGRDATVIHPFVDLDKFNYVSSDDFYFSPARLTPDKRVDAIVEAFKSMPDKKLVVASGGSDLDKIKELAEGSNNISVLGWVSDEKLISLYGTCIASVAASYFEDFGMIAIESMASGKPMIASGDKGFAESIIGGKTGLLINPTKSEIIGAVNTLDKDKAISMKDPCERRAKLFSKEVFISKFKDVVREEIDRSD
jgi:glycosyltransferase involved in cell wall biosynthesis